MKKTSVTKPIENKIAPQYGFRKLRPLKIPKMAWYALLLAFVMAVTLFVLYLITFIGTKDAKRTLLIFNDGSAIPEVSLRNSLAAADFDFEIIEPGKHLDDESYVYEMPKGYGLCNIAFALNEDDSDVVSGELYVGHCFIV